MNRTAAAIIALLPAGLLLGAASQGNPGAETLVIAAAAGGSSWYGSKNTERRRIPVRPGTGRRRAEPADGMALRPRTVAVDEAPGMPDEAPATVADMAKAFGSIDRPHDHVATLQEHRALADAVAATVAFAHIADLPPRTVADPYLYTEDDVDTHDVLADRGAWFTSTGPADSEDLYARAWTQVGS